MPIPPTPKEMFDADYGTPTGLCRETAADSGVRHTLDGVVLRSSLLASAGAAR